MLDKPKVLQALQTISDKLFLNLSDELSTAEQAWHTIKNDATFAYKVLQAQAPWLIPSWIGSLSDVYAVEPFQKPYHMFSVDGSQIYPDRHQGTSCFLINIGTVHIYYNQQQSQAQFQSQPYVFVPSNEQNAGESSIDMVNCRREELEFQASCHVIETNTQPTDQATLLFDGSLIFWHLESKEQTIKEEFTRLYNASLYQLTKQKTLFAGYISAPKNKDLVNLIRLSLAQFDPNTNDDYKKVDHLVDTHIARFFLKPYHRSTLFRSHSPIVDYYPDILKPYFFYLHCGTEIARIEIPQWIATNEELVAKLSSIILDQVNKGHGYPVCLAEAHEQAVVKGADREFFYHLIQKLGFDQQQRLTLSQKSIKKRGIGI